MPKFKKRITHVTRSSICIDKCGTIVITDLAYQSSCKLYSVKATIKGVLSSVRTSVKTMLAVSFTKHKRLSQLMTIAPVLRLVLKSFSLFNLPLMSSKKPFNGKLVLSGISYTRGRIRQLENSFGDQTGRQLSNMQQFVFIKVSGILLNLLSCLHFCLQTDFSSF